MEKQQEIWKWINGYEGLYKVSNLGNVLSFKGKNNENGRQIKICTNNTGYSIFNTYKNKKKKSLRLNVVVCKTFNGEPPEKNYQANHLDGNKKNNRADNLEWATASENNAHAIKNGLRKSFNKGKKSVVQRSLNGQIVARYESASQAARILGLTTSSPIGLACKKQLKTYKNFIWEYYEGEVV